jgi:DNA polymerase I-like protein with 3'-5' exonuclease and polymerase domains
MTTIVDLETSGLSPQRDRITWVGFARGSELALLRHPDDRGKIQAALLGAELLVAHGATFDFRFLLEAGYRLPAEERWRDSQFAAFIAGEGRVALAVLQRRLIAEGVLDESILEPELRIEAWCKREKRAKGEAPVHLLAPYLAADLRSTQAVWGHYRAALNGHESVIELEERLLPAVVAIERRGLPLDLEYAKRFRMQTREEEERLRTERIRLGGKRLEKVSGKRLAEAFAARGVDVSALPTTPAKGWPQFNKITLPTIPDLAVGGGE